MASDSSQPIHRRRTVEEAIAQANAKERIRAALGVRASGGGLTLLGVGFLTRWRTWSYYGQAVRVQIHNGRSFTLSFAAVVGLVAVAVGALIALSGQWLLVRATEAARNDPITATVFDQDAPR